MPAWRDTSEDYLPNDFKNELRSSSSSSGLLLGAPAGEGGGVNAVGWAAGGEIGTQVGGVAG